MSSKRWKPQHLRPRGVASASHMGRLLEAQRHVRNVQFSFTLETLLTFVQDAFLWTQIWGGWLGTAETWQEGDEAEVGQEGAWALDIVASATDDTSISF